MDIEEDFSKERTKVKNQRRNYTMSEKQIVIKNYEEIRKFTRNSKEI